MTTGDGKHASKRKRLRRCAEKLWPLRQMARSRDDARRTRDRLRSERDALIAERDALIAERDRVSGERDALRRERAADLGFVVGVASERDREVTGDPLRRRPKLFWHDTCWQWLARIANNTDTKVLEIGSREVISASLWKSHFPLADYTGFDYHDGANVNVVGDAHKLSSYFDDCKFDIIFSSAVFEHLAMPWIVAEEIAKVLKVGGIVAIETTFAFPEHEMPWHFFQFNSEGLKILFNRKLGFEVLDSGLCNPMVARFSIDSSPYLVGRPLGDLYGHASIVAKKVEAVLGRNSPPFRWAEVAEQVAATTSYPPGTGLSQPGGP